MKLQKESASQVRIKASQDASYRKIVWKKFLDHVRGGRSLDSFAMASWKTIKGLMESFPFECDVEDFEQAQREGKEGWETIGQRQATGHCLGNSRSWYYNMANRYGWSDRVQATVENTHSGTVNVVTYSKPPETPK